ncbi:hypothetical protein VDR45_09595 [Xanthomonas campestris pv. campestris]|nr:hypothetical protein [Xanthomonas campestris pv. campestris]
MKIRLINEETRQTRVVTIIGSQTMHDVSQLRINLIFGSATWFEAALAFKGSSWPSTTHCLPRFTAIISLGYSAGSVAGLGLERLRKT